MCCTSDLCRTVICAAFSFRLLGECGCVPGSARSMLESTLRDTRTLLVCGCGSLCELPAWQRMQPTVTPAHPLCVARHVCRVTVGPCWAHYMDQSPQVVVYVCCHVCVTSVSALEHSADLKSPDPGSAYVSATQRQHVHGVQTPRIHGTCCQARTPLRSLEVHTTCQQYSVQAACRTPK
jgi:hypothetical protein